MDYLLEAEKCEKNGNYEEAEKWYSLAEKQGYEIV